MHGEARRFVADHDALILVEHVEVSLFGPQRALRRGKGDCHALPRENLSGRLCHDTALHKAQSVRDSFLQDLSGDCAAIKSIPDGAVEAQASGAVRDGEAEAGSLRGAGWYVFFFRHHLCALPRTVMVWKDSPMVLPLCRLGTSAPGVSVVITARPMIRR